MATLSPLVDVGRAARACDGETESGDRMLVTPAAAGVLLAVADGLGHGSEAARAAENAIRTVERHARRSLLEILAECHKALLPTRGAALSLACWDAARRVVTWVGVGNVEAVILTRDDGERPARRHLVPRPGVVGVRLPPLVPGTVAVPQSGLLILTTDGIASGFDQNLDPRAAPQALADRILERHSKQADDALVLVASLGG